MLGDRSSLISSWHLLDAVAEGLKHCDRGGSCVHRDQPVALHHNLQWEGHNQRVSSCGSYSMGEVHSILAHTKSVSIKWMQ